MISPRSSRTFFEARQLAGLAPPTCNEEFGSRLLDLLVAGIDHEKVGTEAWYRRILAEAPDAVLPLTEVPGTESACEYHQQVSREKFCALATPQALEVTRRAGGWIDCLTPDGGHFLSVPPWLQFWNVVVPDRDGSGVRMEALRLPEESPLPGEGDGRLWPDCRPCQRGGPQDLNGPEGRVSPKSPLLPWPEDP